MGVGGLHRYCFYFYIVRLPFKYTVMGIHLRFQVICLGYYVSSVLLVINEKLKPNGLTQEPLKTGLEIET